MNRNRHYRCGEEAARLTVVASLPHVAWPEILQLRKEVIAILTTKFVSAADPSFNTHTDKLEVTMMTMTHSVKVIQRMSGNLALWT